MRGTDLKPSRRRPSGAETTQRLDRVCIPERDYLTLRTCADELGMIPEIYIQRVLSNKAAQLRGRA